MTQLSPIKSTQDITCLDGFNLHTTDSCTKITYKPFGRNAYGIAIIYYPYFKNLQKMCLNLESLEFSSNPINHPYARIPVLEEVFFEIDDAETSYSPKDLYKECRFFYASLYQQICLAHIPSHYPFLLTHINQEDEKDLMFFGLWSFIFRHFSYDTKSWGGVKLISPTGHLSASKNSFSL